MFGESGPRFNPEDEHGPQDPLYEINTPANLELRDQALLLLSRGPIAELKLDDLVLMLSLFHRSMGDASENFSDQIPDEIRIIEDVRKLFPHTETLAELRDLFRKRVFTEDLVAVWVNLSANILALTAGNILEGYPEYGISITPGPYRWAPDMIEYFRRKFLDEDPKAEEFLGIYDHSGT